MSDLKNVESVLASDRQLYGASYYREIDGKKMRLPPWEIIITENGELLHNGRGEIIEQLASETRPHNAS